MAKFIITRTSSHYRPYGFAGRHLSAIHFYRKGEKLFTVSRGWLEDERARKDVQSLVLTEEPRLARKSDLTKGGHFYVTATDLGRKTWELYIDVAVGDVKVGDPRDVLLFADSGGETWHKVVDMTLLGTDMGTYDVVNAIAGTASRRQNAYGQKMAEVADRLKELGVEQIVRGLDYVVKDPALMARLNEAATLFAKKEKAA